MFKGLQETIKALNADVKNIANCEKAKKLRKKLLTIGIILAAVGYAGLFTCFILFVTAGDKAFTDNGFSSRIIIPFVLFIPFGFMGGIGSMIASLGLKIVVTGYATNLINEVVGYVCPICGATLDAEMVHCVKCGAKVKKECSNCNFVNDLKNDYCEKCGTKL